MRWVWLLALVSCQPAASGEEAAPSDRYTSAGLAIVADDENPLEGLPIGLTLVATDADGFRDVEARGRVTLTVEGPIRGIPAHVDFTAAARVVRLQSVAFDGPAKLKTSAGAERAWTTTFDVARARRPSRRGDLNADGKVDAADHKLIDEAARTRRRLSGAEILAADIDEDGSVTRLDTAAGIPPDQKPVKPPDLRIVEPSGPWALRNRFVLVVDLPLEFKWTNLRNYVVVYSNRPAPNHPLLKETREGSNLLRACDWASPQGERIRLVGRRLTVDLSGLLRPGPQTITVAATGDTGAIAYASWSGTVAGVAIAGRPPLLCAAEHVPAGSNPVLAWKVEGQAEASLWKHVEKDWREAKSKPFKGLFTHPHQPVTSFAAVADGVIELEATWESGGIQSDRATLHYSAR